MSTWVPLHPQPIWLILKRRKAWSCYINISSWSIAQQCRCQAECFPVAVESKVVTMSIWLDTDLAAWQCNYFPDHSWAHKRMSSFKLMHYIRQHLSSVYLSFWPHASLWARPPIAHLFALSICVSSSEVLTPDNVDVWQILRGTIFRSCIFSISGNTTDAERGCSFAHNAKISL